MNAPTRMVVASVSHSHAGDTDATANGGTTAGGDTRDAAAAARALRERYRSARLRPAKRLGQHFLADLNLARKIVTEVGPPGLGPVLEIGAGLGALTFPLVAAGHSGVAIEVDRRLATWLAEALAPWPRMQVIHGDIRTLDWRADPHEKPLRVVGNLPYYLTSEVLFKLVRAGTSLAGAVIMVQDDVAARLVSPPGTRAYGSLTVAMALRFAIEPVLKVPRQAFWPAPEVDSAVVRLIPRALEAHGGEAWLERVVRAGFAQRRKTLARALAAGLGLARPVVERCLNQLDIDPSRRAETLTPEDFVRLAAVLDHEQRPAEADE